MKYVLLSFLALSILSCKGTQDAVLDDFVYEDAAPPPDNKDVTVVRKGLNDEQRDECYNDRKSLNAISNIEGVVQEVAGSLMIVVGDNKRYQPCSLPKMTQKEGTAVIFSGIIKEIFPGERRAGTPIVISSIDITM